MKIKDYLRMDAEREAKLRAIATFSPKKDMPKLTQNERFSPFDRALIESVLPAANRMLQGAAAYPSTATVCISQTCTHNCSGCPSGWERKRENCFMDPSNFSKVLHSLRSLEVKFINLSGGGEPTLHPSFCEFAQMCIRQQFKLSLMTNAVSLEPTAVQVLVEGFSFLRANLDASSDEVYNRIHNPPQHDEFRKALVSMERIVSERQRRKSDLIFGAEVRICQANTNFLEEITRLATDLGLDYLQFRIKREASDGLQPDQVEGVRKLIEELKVNFFPFPVYGENRGRKLNSGCQLAPLTLAIGPSGDAFPCPRFAGRPEISAFGNIFSLRPDKLWFGPDHKRAVEQLGRIKCRIKDCRWRICGELARCSRR
ncbi:MAG: radical SAM protein [candidate division Zixibacteria bacterium]|nr:radical SAM protein [candidate division Zixibacteria bacterium]